MSLGGINYCVKMHFVNPCVQYVCSACPSLCFVDSHVLAKVSLCTHTRSSLHLYWLISSHNPILSYLLELETVNKQTHNPSICSLSHLRPFWDRKLTIKRVLWCYCTIIRSGSLHFHQISLHHPFLFILRIRNGYALHTEGTHGFVCAVFLLKRR